MDDRQRELREQLNQVRGELERINGDITILEFERSSLSDEEYNERLTSLNNQKQAYQNKIEELSDELNSLNQPNIQDEALQEDGEIKTDIESRQKFQSPDYDFEGKFVPRKNNLLNATNNFIFKLQDMVSEYENIPLKWSKYKNQILRERSDVINLTEEQRKKALDDICDEFDIKLEMIEKDDSLSYEEKEEKKQKIYEQLAYQTHLYEEFCYLSQQEQDKEVDEEIRIIDEAIEKEQKNVKNAMGNRLKLRINSLGLYLKKGYDRKEVYEALTVLAQVNLDNKDLEKYLRTVFDETLFRNKELHNIYVSYSAYENEAENHMDDEAENHMDDEAENHMDDEAENHMDDEAETLSDGEPEEQDIQVPVVEGNSPKKTWKTWVSLAAGIGVGAAVFFTTGSLGVSVMAIAGGIAKRLIAKRRKKLELQRLRNETPIEGVEEPLPGIKGKIQKLKNYFKSEEFCRDAKWFLNGAIYTGLGLNVASSIYNLVNPDVSTASTADLNSSNTTSSTGDSSSLTSADTSSITTTTESNALTDIKIGSNVDGYNVSVGHDTASWATSGTNSETLISQYVNENSIFKRFAVVGSDGSVSEIVADNGLSLADFCSQNGIDPSQIAVDVANKDGVSQAWISVQELTKGIGGK